MSWALWVLWTLWTLWTNNSEQKRTTTHAYLDLTLCQINTHRDDGRAPPTDGRAAPTTAHTECSAVVFHMREACRVHGCAAGLGSLRAGFACIIIPRAETEGGHPGGRT